jgi:hypothetical protein
VLKLGMGLKNLPQSVFIAKEEVLIMDHDAPAEYGGSSNVHEGLYRGNRVAIKILRSQVITKVC